MSEVKITLRGHTELQRKFNKLAKKIDNKNPMFKQVGILLMNQVSKNFDTESDAGKKWKKLSDATIANRRKGKNVAGVTGVKILQDSGDLRKSIVREHSNSMVRVGTPIKYAPTHEDGASTGKGWGGPIPKRPFMVTEHLGLTIAVDYTETFINNKIRESNL